ncbi:putative leucine Rich Repeat protein, partial [Listeria seeligeri FSL S4-171]
DGLQSINLYDCNITEVPFDAWSNLTHLGENEEKVNLSGNHLTQIPESIVFNSEWGFPIVAVDETYTFEPITIQQGESHSLYLPIIKQFNSQAETAIMGEYIIDGQGQALESLTPQDYYVSIPTEDLTVGTHNINLYVRDYYGSHLTGNYVIDVTVE